MARIEPGLQADFPFWEKSAAASPPHGIVQMTTHSKACLDATEEVARLLGERLRHPPIDAPV